MSRFDRGERLRSGLQTRHHYSIGALIGRLDAATLHDRREAGLWLERTGERVATVGEGPPLTDLIGLDPDLIKGMDPGDYPGRAVVCRRPGGVCGTASSDHNDYDRFHGGALA